MDSLSHAGRTFPDKCRGVNNLGKCPLFAQCARYNPWPENEITPPWTSDGNRATCKRLVKKEG
jgi:hypothetical protein